MFRCINISSNLGVVKSSVIDTLLKSAVATISETKLYCTNHGGRFIQELSIAPSAPQTTSQIKYCLSSTNSNRFNLVNAGFNRRISISSTSCNQENKEEAEVEEAKNEEDSEDEKPVPSGQRRPGKDEPPLARHLDKDRTKNISVETSMRYLKSQAYKDAYGDKLIWILYRRNFKGQFAPKHTRKTCIRGGNISAGNPCPICRDEYLVVHPRNVELLKQFISPYNGTIIGYDKTGVCRRQHERIVIAIDKARDLGLITFDVPFREYDYKEYQAMYESH